MNNKHEWNDDIVEISKKALHTLKVMNLPENPAIIFDIDDTLIDSSNGKSIDPIVMIYNYAKMIGIIPIIITSRPGYSRVIEWTKNQLLNNGITGYNSLYLIPVNKIDSWKFKLYARKNVYQRGYNIVMSLGDQDWDIGEYGGIGIKIPVISSY
jgi:predicted secreted acid phosphatase